MHAFKKLSYKNIFGVEPGSAAKEVAKKLYEIDTIYEGFLDDAPKLTPLANADIVCLSSVIGHLVNPKKQLEYITQKLKTNVMLVLEMPDLEYFLVEDREPFGEMSIEHINYFSAKSIELLLNNVGFKILSIKRLLLDTGPSLMVFAQPTKRLIVVL